MQGRGRNAIVWIAAAVTATAAAGMFAVSRWGIQRSAADSTLQLEATETEGHIRLSWNPQETRVKRASAATLEVRDGSRIQSYPVNGDALRRGSVDYVHGSDDVLITLTLVENGAPRSRGMVRAISGLAPEARPKAPARAQRNRSGETTATSRHKAKPRPHKKVARKRRR